MTFYLMTFALKYEHVSAVEGAPDGSSHRTPTFEVEIKGPLEVTIELHLKMHMVVHLLVQQSSQNNSMKRELGEALYVALEGASKTSLLEAQKLKRLWKKKDAFDIAVEGSLDDAMKDTALNLKLDSLHVIYILYSAEQTELLTFSN